MIIGITGWFSSGKDTVADYLKVKGFEIMTMSTVIRAELDKVGKDHSRDNMRDMGNELRDKHGPDYLAKECLEMLRRKGGDKYVIVGIRQPAEVKELRKNSDFQLWEINAPIETRHARLIKRARSEDEESISLEDFATKEEKEKCGGENCQQIDLVVAMADHVIDNSGTIDELHEKVDKLISEAR